MYVSADDLRLLPPYSSEEGVTVVLIFLQMQLQQDWTHIYIMNPSIALHPVFSSLAKREKNAIHIIPFCVHVVPNQDC